MQSDNKGRQQPLTVKVSGLVWSLRICDDYIAVESRSTEQKKVSFSCFNLKSGAITFKDRSFDEEWNLRLHSLVNTTILLQLNTDGPFPENKGILAINRESGRILWSDYNLAIERAGASAVQVFDSRLLPRKYFWIDPVSKETIPGYPEPPDQQDHLVFPDVYDKLPSAITAPGLTGPVWILDHQGKKFVSFHEQSGGIMKQRLLVFQDDKVILEDILASGIQKLQPEAFFIHHHYLVYIRNKAEIVSYLV